jgi:cell division septal protein FtsQ
MNKSFVNRKKKKFQFNILVYLMICVLFVYSFFNYQKIIILSSFYIQKYSDKYNYNLSKIEISKLQNIGEKEILYFFDAYKEKSIFLIPVKKISKNMQKIKWINSINIKSNYKNVLFIDIVEEKPFAIYDNNNQKILFSENLVFLKILKNNTDYRDLITFYGMNSLDNSKKFILSLERSFLEDISSATYINNRRWNLILKNGILLKLPENNFITSLENYKKIYVQFSNNDLKNIKIIDLRLINKVIIRYKDDLND